MKTNIDFLRELIQGDEEALEFLEAIEDDLKDKDDEISSLGIEVKELEGKVSYLEGEIESNEGIIEIDCGIGVIRYEEPDNLKLQTIMEELKEQLEEEAKFGNPLPRISLL